MRLVAALVTLLVGFALATPAAADGTVAQTVVVEALPVLAQPGSLALAVPVGWNEVLVRVQNSRAAPIRGKVVVTSREYSHRGGAVSTAEAPFVAVPSASVNVRIPIRIAPYSDCGAEVMDQDTGERLGGARFTTFPQGNVVLVDVSEASRLRGILGDMPISPAFEPPGFGSGRSAAAPSPVVSVVVPRFDPATGDPLLPDRAALYTSADALFIRSDALTRLTGADLDALAGFVLGGGTLAISVARPEDVRHPTLVALLGGEATITGVSATALQNLVPPLGLGSPGASKSIPHARNPTDETLKALVGHSGGNLHGSPYGNSAAYGLGEVHLLAFDPTRKPAAEDPWAHARLLDLARRAFDRRASVVYRSSSASAQRDISPMRRLLDPNESSRWAIAAAALLLCIYAVFAGPVNFSRASKKQRPLRALRYLPIYSAGAFMLVVGIGITAKGTTGRARHVTLIEAGSGMKKGIAHRYRGFYAARATDLTVRTSDTTSVVSSVLHAEATERRERLVVDREGARLADVAALPWQTIVVLEEGYGSLGDGLSLTREGDKDVLVTNRTGKNIRGGLLRTPDGRFAYIGALKDGDKASSATAKDPSSVTAWTSWQSAATSAVRRGGMALHPLAAHALGDVFEKDAPGLAEAFGAVEHAAPEGDWFPDGTPTLVAQLDGGEGRRVDSGLAIESDRLLVRVVGFGGKP